MKIYGKANTEEDLMLESSISREIVAKIMDYGVSQHQIKCIIKILAMELEDRDIMISIKNCLEKNENEKVYDNKIVT